jgi:DNA repair protein RadC
MFSTEAERFVMRSGKGFNTIGDWPESDRPREKLHRQGAHRLSNSELLAILLRTGVHGQSAIDLARRILREFVTFRNMSAADISRWRRFKGLGPAKIAQVKAALEIGRRFREDETTEKKTKIANAADVVDILGARMRDLKREVFKVVLLNTRNRIIDIIEITEGTVNQAAPMMREIFQRAMQGFATSIICVHNHPSGNPNPSGEDCRFTMDLSLAGRVLQLKVLDHIIVGDGDYYSFAEEGRMGQAGD